MPGRPLACFGIGYFFYEFSDELQDGVAAAGSFKDEQGIEAHCNLVPAPWLRSSAHLQWVNPANGAVPSLGLDGLRLRVAF